MFHRLDHCGRWSWQRANICHPHLPKQWPNLRNVPVLCQKMENQKTVYNVHFCLQPLLALVRCGQRFIVESFQSQVTQVYVDSNYSYLNDHAMSNMYPPLLDFDDCVKCAWKWSLRNVMYCKGLCSGLGIYYYRAVASISCGILQHS